MNRLGVQGEAIVLSVVVPTRNEAGNVQPLVAGIAAAVGDLPTEVIFVDDSSDETPAILERIAAEPPAGLVVRVIQRPLERRNGLGLAAVEGLKQAGGLAVAVMDGDLQHPPELLPRMLTALREGEADLVVASRYAPGGSARGLSGPARRLVSGLSRRFAQVLFREARKTSDPLSGYFLCRQLTIDGLEFRPIGFKVLLEILVCTPAAVVTDVPLRFGTRGDGASNASINQGWLFLKHVATLVLQVRGSARFWKYALVGGAGLTVFLGLLVGGYRVGLGAFQAWALAFVVSIFLNWQLNRVFTFADVASPFTPGRSRPVYLPVALLGGCVNLVVFAVLLPRLGLPLGGVGGAVAAMALNFLAQRGILRRPPRITPAATDSSPIETRVSALVEGAVRVFGPDADLAEIAEAYGQADVPAELLGAAERRKPALVAEAPSRVPQARNDIGMSAWMGVPMIEGRRYLGVLVAHRQGSPYSAEELDTVLRSLRIESRSEVPELAGLRPTAE